MIMLIMLIMSIWLTVSSTDILEEAAMLMMMMLKVWIMLIMFRIRLIVSSTDISEEAELRLTSRLNETIKNYWVALGNIRIIKDADSDPNVKHNPDPNSISRNPEDGYGKRP